MAFPDFGGPVSKPVEVPETAATRYNRDVQQQGVENVLTVAEGASLSSYTATTIAATASGGRTDRALLQEATERQDRLYVDIATGNSAVTGTKDAQYDSLKAAAETHGAAQTALVNYDGTDASVPHSTFGGF